MERSLHAMGVWVAGCVAVALAPSVACTGTPHPPMLGGETSDAGGGDAGVTLFAEAGGEVPSCTVGVEGGVCACADQPLLLDPPNLYFVLDRSGSMADPYDTSSNNWSKWTTVQQVIGNLVIALGPRANFGAAVFPDPVQDSCAPGKQVFPTVGGDPYPGKVGSTALALLTTLGHIPASGGTPTAATLQALAPTIAGLKGKTYVIFATDGGPNCDGGAMCTAATCTDNIDGIQGCPPGGPPNCCTDPNYGGALACLDAQPTIDAVTALASAGIPVYVVGLPASGPYATLLEQLAQAGGTTQYYAPSDQAAFSAAMSKIAAKITGTCTLTLNTAPPDPGLVNVFFDGQPLPQAGPNGWTLSGATVTVLGTSCQAILDGDVIDVRVVAGCPTVTR